MGYAGFEIFAKACLGKSEKGGLEQEDFERLVAACRLPKLVIYQPLVNAQTSRWLSREDEGDPIAVLGDFLRLRSGHKDFLHDWFRGRAIASHDEALTLAKILRHTTAHGVLSPAKCVGLGLTDALRILPKAIDEVRRAVTYRIYECR